MLRVVAKGGQVTASAGLGIAARPLPRIGAAPDTLMVAGGPGVEAAIADPVLIKWIRERARNARRVASVCTGAFLLAASGVLDGRRAVTHWSYCAALARRFPAVHVESDPIFVRDGAVWTSAGVTAGIDLALALVEEDLGRTVGRNHAPEFPAPAGHHTARLSGSVQRLKGLFFIVPHRTSHTVSGSSTRWPLSATMRPSRSR